jgi:hypothetical protein
LKNPDLQSAANFGISCSPKGNGGQPVKAIRMDVFQSQHMPMRSNIRACGWKEGSMTIIRGERLSKVVEKLPLCRHFVQSCAMLKFDS